MRAHLLFGVVLITGCPRGPEHPFPPPATGSGSSSATEQVAPPELTLETLAEGVAENGFTTTAVYLDAADRPIGARFVHIKTRFTFDYLRIESAPQGYIWVNSFPTSDKGEPHTQEHLLLGKGDRGRQMGSFQAMALAESSAFTGQWQTAYHFHTVAGHDVFWPVFVDQLDALLHPDYTDEEIRREVRNFGVDKSDDGTLRLEEKGTVYNEMVRSYESPDAALWRAAGQMIYGTSHPLSYESGGYPDAIRTMTADDIRRFHADAYHLANMGMIAAFPASMRLDQVLDHTDEVLNQEAGGTGTVKTEADLPAPAPAAAGTVQVVDYPDATTTAPGPMLLAWPATRDLDLEQRTLLALFLDAFAGDETTPMYHRFIDSKTRTLDLGASGVGSYASTDQGEPVFITLEGVRADRLDDGTIGKVRTEVMAELARIAKLPDGDPDLIAFDQRVQSRVIDLRRRLAKFLDTPPGFGFRGTGSGWADQLRTAQRAGGFRKSLTLRPQLDAIDALLSGTANPWRDRLPAWGLLETPFGAAARPSPTLRAALDTARKQRVTDELARLGAQYKTKGAAATLARYQTDYDAQTHDLEQAAKAVPLPPLVATPPMTYDDELRYTTDPVAGLPALRATVDTMSSARVALAFRVDAVPEDDLMFLALLPALMQEVGVIDNGTVIASDVMRERLRKEILELSVYYTEDLRSGRDELVVAGAGNDAAETRLALGWMARVMFAADWRVDNLPRLRDVVDQAVTAIRQTTQGSEEDWVWDPHDAWWRQDWPLHLHTSSFMTQAHDLHRLRWMLLDPADPKATADATAFLTTLAGAKTLPRAQLVKLAAALADPTKTRPTASIKRWTVAAAKLSPAAKQLAIAAGKDLTALIADLPDGSLAADWAYLCRQMARDLGFGAPAALARLASVRDAVIAASTARVVEVGSTATETAIASDVAALLGQLDPAPRVAQTYSTRRPIAARLRDHDHAAAGPAFVGLLVPSTSSGVFLNTAPATALTDTSEDAVLDYLAGNLYTGHGAHSLFMKTWAAGLAYSNGIRPSVREGRITYYAERCPLLPQTLRFVIDQVKAATPDDSIVRYAIATAFDSRIAEGYEQRAGAMAADLADGVTPDVVRAFRARLLALADRADLAATLWKRLPAVYGKVLPGYGTPSPDAVQFVIGPAAQLDAYQAYLRGAVGKTTTLHRLYPRDFWVPGKQ